MMNDLIIAGLGRTVIKLQLPLIGLTLVETGNRASNLITY
jgi:hypothetical protein